MSLKVEGVACVNIPVKNIEQSIDFYVNQLGCQLVRGIQRTENATNAFIQFGEDGLNALLHEEDSNYQLHYKRMNKDVPLIELHCSDVRSFFNQLRNDNAEVIGDISKHSCGDRFYVIDPDENKLLIIQK
ncbi:VOC family protein [Sutcliffiella cohnii]